MPLCLQPEYTCVCVRVCTLMHPSADCIPSCTFSWSFRAALVLGPLMARWLCAEGLNCQHTLHACLSLSVFGAGNRSHVGILSREGINTGN